MPAVLTPTMEKEKAEEQISAILTELERKLGMPVSSIDTWHTTGSEVGVFVHFRLES